MLTRRKPAPAGTPPPLDQDDLVRLAYRVALRGEPDGVGLASYAAHLRAGRDFAWLLETLANSDEFRALAAPATPEPMPTPEAAPRPEVPQLEAAHILAHRPPMPIDTSCTEDELQRLWDHVAATWSALGDAEPHWSILTEDRFRTGSADAAALDAFYRTGESELERLNAWLTRNGLVAPPGVVCAEFGCGVGRITRSLARQYGSVLALDVSVPHLRTAEARLAAEGIGNVRFVPLAGRASLDALRDIDVFYSIIALQHSPPPIILDVLDHAFAGLRPGGTAYFQLPTYGDDYRYAVATHLAALEEGRNAQGSAADEMEVHFLPQSTVLALAHRHGLRVVEIQPDTSAGKLDRWISNTFLLARDR